jgi:hypothetical protein
VIQGNRASLVVHSDVRTVSEISALLGFEPDRWGESGEVVMHRRGRPDVSRRRPYPHSFWASETITREPASEDQTGFAALRELVDLLEPCADALAELRQDGETIIWWSGDSDSTQGGFVLEADLLRRAAILGCDVYGTTYLSEDADDG